MTLNKMKTYREEARERYLYDFFAPKLLVDKDSRDYLLLIISKALGMEFDDIKKDFEIVDFRIGLSEKNKDSEGDIVAYADVGYISVEVNCIYNERNMVKNTTYICELILRQLDKYENKKRDYLNIRPIYQINLNNYDMFKKNEFIYTSVLMEKTHKIPRPYNLIEIVDVNIDFLKKMQYTSVKKLKRDSLERLLYVFANSNRSELDELYWGDKLMEKVKSKLYDLDKDLDNYLIYDKEAMIKEEIFIDGKNQGIEQEKNKKLLEIKNLIQNGISMEIILKSFELTEEEKEFLTN